MSKMKVVVDNREKKPWRFPGLDNVVYDTLDVGDYTLEGFEHVFAVERKSLNDLASSLGSERERFEDEVKRAQSMEEFAVVVESPRELVAAYQDSKYCPNYYSKLYPKTIISTEKSWTDRYDVLDWHWCDGREDAKQEALRLLDKWYLMYGTDLY